MFYKNVFPSLYDNVFMSNVNTLFTLIINILLMQATPIIIKLITIVIFIKNLNKIFAIEGNMIYNMLIPNSSWQKFTGSHYLIILCLTELRFMFMCYKWSK